jgi:transposase
LAKSSSVFTKSCQTIRNWFGEIISYFERRTTKGASHFCNKQLYLDAKYLYGKPFREFIDFQRFSKLCDWNQNRYYKSLLTLLSIYTHYIIGMLPTTNGVVEGINNKLKLIKRRGYGLRNFRNFWVRSMLSWHLVC